MSKEKWPPDIVEVEWVDSMRYSNWASSEDHIKSMEVPETMLHRSCGYLVKECSEYVAVTHSVGIGVQSVLDSIQIPRQAVKSIKRIK